MGLTYQFLPGDCVIVGDDIHGVIERIIFSRDMVVPLYLVEWWDCGEYKAKEFNERDVRRVRGEQE